MNPYRFFFSYASETHRASSNLLEEFYNALCKRVALETGHKINEVSYRDQNRLTLGSFWSKGLVDALQSSNVLVSIICPHYLKSEACGREVEFFIRRFNLCKELGEEHYHRIIPIFWIDKTSCIEHMHHDVEAFLNTLQFSQKGLPETYPHTGLYRYYLLEEKNCYNRLVDIVGMEIKRLSDLQTLPKLAGAGDFSDLPSFFKKKEMQPEPKIVIGPKSTNVIYAVATRDEAVACGLEYKCRSIERTQWFPFADAPGASIEMATLEGLNTAGQNDTNYENLGLPKDLGDKLKQAKINNSPVLIVLDHESLAVQEIKDRLSDYDDRDFPNVGLVSAGKQDTGEKLLMQTMPTKFGEKRPNHLWTVPLDRSRYVQEVVEVVGGLRRTVQQTGHTSISLPASSLPGL